VQRPGVGGIRRLFLVHPRRLRYSPPAFTETPRVKPVNRDPSPPDLRRFGLTMLGGFAAIGALLWWLGRAPGSWGFSGSGRHVAAIALWGLGVAFCGAGCGPRALARPFYVGWMTFASALGWLMTNVILSLLYFLFLPVFSLIRLRDPLRFRLTPGASYWEPHRAPEPTLERMSRMF